MIETIELSCRSCGGTLDIHADDDVLACGHCGSQMIVQRRGGSVSLRGVEAAIGRVQAATDKTAAELAIGRHKEKLAGWEAERAALLAANKWTPRAYETTRTKVAKRRGRVGWTLGRKFRWGFASLLVFLGSIGKFMEGNAPRGAGVVMWLTLLTVLQTVVIVLFAYVAKRWLDRREDAQVGAVDVVDATIVRLNARIAEKTRIADS